MVAVFTGTDYANDGIAMPKAAMPRKKRDGSPMFAPQRPALVVDRARYVGDPVAMVIAETLAQAKDAAELVAVDYEPLPSVTSVAEAAEPDAPRVWDENPDNISHTTERGNRQATDAAFAQAAHIVKRRYVVTRVHAQYMEPRGAIGTYDPAEDRYTLYADVNYPHRVRNMLANMVFKVPESSVRVVCHDVGGGFGAKGWQYVEHRLTLWAARKIERPVKWRCERSEVILADEHGRDNVGTIELAFDANAKIIGLRLHMLASIGAYIASDRQLLTPFGQIGTVVGMYDIPAACVTHRRGAVQHQPDRALSRRRPSGGELSDRARDGGRGARTGHRSDRTAPPQHHSRCEDAVQDGARSVLRLRRSSAGTWRWRWKRPTTPASRRGARHRARVACCAASASPTRSSRPPDRRRNTPKSASSRAAARSC